MSSEMNKCPFTGAGTPPKHPTGRGTSNRDWWPNALNIHIKIILNYLTVSLE